jgi:putative GTP pyrophosphokinase
MASNLSKTQIDKLGERLKRGNITEADLRLLDQYRRSFTEAYEIVVGKIRNELKLEPTGRPAKSTTSISDKLRRESIRLTQIQDIAGCRLIVQNIAEQDSVIKALENLFERTTVVDRREKPSHGYRAVHVVVSNLGKSIEVQVRTLLQQLWAELSEKFSDVVDPAIKYGGGDNTIRELLTLTSSIVAKEELLEEKLADQASSQVPSQGGSGDDTKLEAADYNNLLGEVRRAILSLLYESIVSTEKIAEGVEGESDVVSD